MTLHSYSSPLAVGHAFAKGLFDGPVVIEEKIDGSQFSFGVSTDGVLMARSRGQQLVLDAPEGMFAKAVELVTSLHADKKLIPGHIYRGEYLQKPKHNTLAYGRAPRGHFVLFDVEIGLYAFLPTADKLAEAERLGVEPVRVLYEGVVESAAFVRELIPAESMLGGPSEGVVVKNYAQIGPDKKVLMGKMVTEAFKERHGGEWKAANPTGKDKVEEITESLRTTARWQKAVQHLREAEALEGSPKDIGALLKEVHCDIERECGDEIKEALYKWAIAKIKRGAVSGLPEWYKRQLEEAA